MTRPRVVPQSARTKAAGVTASRPEAVRATTTAEKVARVLERLERGELVGASCRAEHLKRDTLYRWRDASPVQGAAYARARELCADVIAEEVVTIADDSSGDTFTDAQGVTRQNYEFAARSRLRIEARKWLVATINPKRYGDQANVDMTTGGQPIAELLHKGRERVARLRAVSA